MDMIYIAMTALLAKSQPLIAVLGLTGSVASVQLAAIFVIAVISIAVSVSILSLMIYGLKKMTNKADASPKPKKQTAKAKKQISKSKTKTAKNKKKKFIPELESESESESESEPEAPKLESDSEGPEGPVLNEDDILPPLDDEDSVLGFLKKQKKIQDLDEEIFEDTPEIIEARKARDIAQELHNKVVKDETAFRNQLPDKYGTNYPIYEASKKKAQDALVNLKMAQAVFEKLYEAEKKRTNYDEKVKAKQAAQKAADIERVADQKVQVIKEVPIAIAKVAQLQTELLEAEQTKTLLESTPKEKRNPKVKLDYCKVSLKIIDLNFKLLEAKFEASQAALFADVAEESENRKALKSSNIYTPQEIESLIVEGRKALQGNFTIDKENFEKAELGYETANTNAKQAVKKAQEFHDTEREKILAKKRAAGNPQPPAVAAVDIEQPDVLPPPLVQPDSEVQAQSPKKKGSI